MKVGSRLCAASLIDVAFVRPVAPANLLPGGWPAHPRGVPGTLAGSATPDELPAKNWRRTNIRDGRTRAQPKIDGAFHKKFPIFDTLDEIFLLAFCRAPL
jgi:hypothetical protein